MPALNRIRRNDLLTLLIVLFAAALVRLAAPGIIEYKLDEAWLTRLAREFVGGGPLPLLGMPSSVGVPNPPASVYVLALPFALTSNPLIVTLFIAVLNIVGVDLLWLIAHRYVGRTVALVAGLMYALSPWAVFYSRKIWAQDVHTPFVLAALLLGLFGFVEGKRWAQVVCLPLLVFALQIHFAAWALLPLFLWFLWVGRKRLWGPGVVLSVVLAALTLVPYAAGMAQLAEQNPDRLPSGLPVRAAPQISDAGLRIVGELTTGIGLTEELAHDDAPALRAAVPAQPAFWALLGVAAALGLVIVWLPRYRPLAGLIVLWVALPVGVFLVEWTGVYYHYFIATIPALCLLVGVALDWLSRRLPGQPLSGTIILTVFAAILLTQFIWWRGVMRYVSLNPVESYGTPLGALMPVRDALINEAHTVLVSDSAALDYSREPAIWHAMLTGDGRCFQAVSGADVLVFPPNPFSVLVAPNGQDIDLPAYVLQVGVPYPTNADGEEYRLYPLASADPARMPDWTETTARFANETALTGYTLEDGVVRLRWQTPDGRDAQYQYFVHLLDADGERIGQYDGPFLDGRMWCDTSTVVTRQPLDNVDTAATLRVGMYRLVNGGFVNADLLDGDGNPVAPWYDIPLTPNTGP